MKVCLAVLIMCMLLGRGVAYEIIVDSPQPKETICLKWPESGRANWKEINRQVTEEGGIVERIPCQQTMQNWSELLRMQQYHSPNTSYSMEVMLDRIRDTTLASYPGKKVIWNIIEKNANDAIYEWILSEPYKNVVPQHEIARCFVTKTGYYTIGFVHKNGNMDAKEREKWHTLFKESASVVSFAEATDTVDSISIVSRFIDSVDLGPDLQDWDKKQVLINNTGVIVQYIQVERGDVKEIPGFDTGRLQQVFSIDQLEEAVREQMQAKTESLLVNAIYHVGATPIDQMLALIKDVKQKETSTKLKFHTLKSSPVEVIYSCSYPKQKLYCTEVTRVFISNWKCYFVVYVHEARNALKQEEILKWKEKLESIHIRD